MMRRTKNASCALKQAKGNKKLAAKMLGIGRSTLYNKLDEYGLNEEN